MKYKLISVFSLLFPYMTFACGFNSTNIYSAIFEIIFFTIVIILPPALIFYAVLRFVPKFKIKGITWAFTRAFIFSLVIALPIGWVVFQLSASSLCL